MRNIKNPLLKRKWEHQSYSLVGLFSSNKYKNPTTSKIFRTPQHPTPPTTEVVLTVHFPISERKENFGIKY